MTINETSARAENRWHNPFIETISDATLDAWASQFLPEEHSIVRRLLAHFSFYGPNRLNAALVSLHEKVISVLNRPVTSVWFIPVGYAAKSGSMIAYLYKTQNDIPQERFILANDLTNVRLTPESAVVFLDDYIGSGHQGRQVWDTVLSLISTSADICPFIFGAIVGTEKGKRHLASNTGFQVLTVDEIDEGALPLHDQSRVFPDPEERRLAREVLEEYGKRLYPSEPLGYENSQGLLGFFYSTPNNTLPIFWSTADGWIPILRHKETYRDPAFLVGPPAGLTKEISVSGPERPLLESARLEDYDLPFEVATRLLNEFRTMPIVLSLIPAIQSLEIDDATIGAILRLVIELRHLKHEKESVRTSLLIIPNDMSPDSIGDIHVLPSGTLSLSTSRAQTEIVQLVQWIGGFEGGVVINASGDVLGSVIFRKTTTTSYPLLPERYHRVARASLDSRGLLFLFSGNDRATVFYLGNRMLTYRGASWHLQPSDLPAGISQLAREYHISEGALHHLFRMSLRLSDEGQGAFATIGNHEEVLKYSDLREASRFQWPSLHVKDSDPDAVFGLMKQDGATIIRADGQIVQGLTTIRPPAGKSPLQDRQKGTKHHTAATISMLAKCIAVAVSVDGQITVFAGGTERFKLMG